MHDRQAEPLSELTGEARLSAAGAADDDDAPQIPISPRATARITAGCSAAEKAALFAGTAS